jgi:hypothetical protein
MPQIQVGTEAARREAKRQRGDDNLQRLANDNVAAQEAELELLHAEAQNQLELGLGWSQPGQPGLDARFQSLKVAADQEGLIFAGEPVKNDATLVDVLKRTGSAVVGASRQIEALDAMARERFGPVWDLLTFPKFFFDSLANLASQLRPSITPPTKPEPPSYTGPQFDPGVPSNFRGQILWKTPKPPLQKKT